MLAAVLFWSTPVHAGPTISVIPPSKPTTQPAPPESDPPPADDPQPGTTQPASGTSDPEPTPGFSPPPNSHKTKTAVYSAAQVNRWAGRQIDGKVVMVSPVISAGPNGELSHYHVEVDYSGTGKVAVGVATFNADNLDLALKKRSYVKPRSARSGKPVLLIHSKPRRNHAWLLIQADRGVRINKVSVSYRVGESTIFGHEFGLYTFAGARLPYRLMYPVDYDPKKSYPLVLSVSGSGGVGSDNASQMEPILLSAYLFHRYGHIDEFACFSLVPQIPPAKAIPKPYWPMGPKGGPEYPYHPDWPTVNEGGWYVEATLALIQDLIAHEDVPIDADRVYFTGYSYGGKACWEFLKAGRDVFAAAMSGGGWPIGRAYGTPTGDLLKRLKMEATRYKHIPVLIFAGEKDRMRFASKALHETLQGLGAKSRYVEIEGQGHIPAAFRGWSDRESIKWLFSQSRSDNPKPGKDPYPGGIYRELPGRRPAPPRR